MDPLQLVGEFLVARREVKAKALEAVREAAEQTEADARSHAPYLTGALQRSLHTTNQGLIADVGSDLDYAPFVEYGTSEMAPQPYLGPAVDKAVSVLVRKIEEAGSF